MPFSTPLFVWSFLPLVLALYFGLRPRYRNGLLLSASLFFYAWGETLMVGVLLLSCVANWAFGCWLEARAEPRARKRVLLLGIVFNIGLLVAFKYADWLWSLASPSATLGELLASTGSLGSLLLDKNGHVHLPIGVSFFTFQGTSYLVDIYRGDVGCERSLVGFSMYKTFFPQLVAGPIVRYRDVHEQVEKREVRLEGFAVGVRRFVLGLGKKMLIADVVAAPCDRIFALHAAELTTPLAWLGIVCYALQIYFDFSAYSDMAIGMGRMFGFTFLENFLHPYVSGSISEFWRRWHVSLSTWFRDYVYIPLGGSRGSPGRTYLNLVAVFFLCGLWHGASFNFVVWGLWHGVFLVLERAFLSRWSAAWPRVLRHVYVLLVVLIGWVFFRAADLRHALDYLETLCGWYSGDPRLHHVAHFTDAEVWTAIACGVIGSLPWLERALGWWRGLEGRGRPRLAAALEFASIGLLALVFLDSALKLAAGSYSPFIYFRF